MGEEADDQEGNEDHPVGEIDPQVAQEDQMKVVRDERRKDTAEATRVLTLAPVVMSLEEVQEVDLVKDREKVEMTAEEGELRKNMGLRNPIVLVLDHRAVLEVVHHLLHRNLETVSQEVILDLVGRLQYIII